ncbi:MAG TPA: phosphatidylglycerol lysyltransferase domain-containing protein [bacterium]|nr:phosphatidylglycerol lysyltransferase domain-containing protein [bacterium]
METYPQFPHFKPVELADRDFIRGKFWSYQPEISELTFTSFFIWRTYYQFQWCLLDDCFVAYCQRHGRFFATEPVGSGDRPEVVRKILKFLQAEKGEASPTIERVDRTLAAELEKAGGFHLEPVRDYFDYLYRTEDLIKLPGRRYHRKRNHIRQFLKQYRYEYRPVDKESLPGCLDLAARWCRARRCEEDLGLLEEREAVLESLKHFEALQIQGGLILVNQRVEAFALGELLNRETAVIHIEKASPELPSLYAVINQQFAEKAWSKTTWINREEDLGEENLRKAKESYYPERLVEKFRVRLAG